MGKELRSMLEKRESSFIIIRCRVEFSLLDFIFKMEIKKEIKVIF